MAVSTTAKPSRKRMNLRDRYMDGIGLAVLRFSDKEVFENLSGVVEEIWNHT